MLNADIHVVVPEVRHLALCAELYCEEPAAVRCSYPIIVLSADDPSHLDEGMHSH